MTGVWLPGNDDEPDAPRGTVHKENADATFDPSSEVHQTMMRERAAECVSLAFVPRENRIPVRLSEKLVRKRRFQFLNRLLDTTLVMSKIPC